MKKIGLIQLFVLLALPAILQEAAWPDKSVYSERDRSFYHNVIMPALGEETGSSVSDPVLRVMLDGYDFPVDTALYRPTWHNPPVSQGRTGTCWAFAPVSMLESEVFRLSGEKIRLSELFIVYWEYVERIREVAKREGKVYFSEGSEANGVTRMISLHGIVPWEIYPGKPADQQFHDHKEMFRKLRTYKEWVEANEGVTEKEAVTGIREILSQYMGEVPKSFLWKGNQYSPDSFAREYLPFKPHDYFNFMSTASLTYNQRGELVEPDNWWRSDDYYNLTVEDFAGVVERAVKLGFPVTLCGDVSEPGFDGQAEVSIIPVFDIPGEYINEHSRELRLSNKSTTNDHCIHVCGYHERDDGVWYMLKDSGSGAFDGPNKGYRFMHEDYIKLKIMTVMVHKEAAREVLDRIIK